MSLRFDERFWLWYKNKKKNPETDEWKRCLIRPLSSIPKTLVHTMPVRNSAGGVKSTRFAIVHTMESCLIEHLSGLIKHLFHSSQKPTRKLAASAFKYLIVELDESSRSELASWVNFAMTGKEPKTKTCSFITSKQTHNVNFCSRVAGSIPTVVRLIFQLAWCGIYTQSNNTLHKHIMIITLYSSGK